MTDHATPDGIRAARAQGVYPPTTSQPQYDQAGRALSPLLDDNSQVTNSVDDLDLGSNDLPLDLGTFDDEEPADFDDMMQSLEDSRNGLSDFNAEINNMMWAQQPAFPSSSGSPSSNSSAPRPDVDDNPDIDVAALEMEAASYLFNVEDVQLVDAAGHEALIFPSSWEQASRSLPSGALPDGPEASPAAPASTPAAAITSSSPRADDSDSRRTSDRTGETPPSSPPSAEKKDDAIDGNDPSTSPAAGRPPHAADPRRQSFVQTEATSASSSSLQHPPHAAATQINTTSPTTTTPPSLQHPPQPAAPPATATSTPRTYSTLSTAGTKRKALDQPEYVPGRFTGGNGGARKRVRKGDANQGRFDGNLLGRERRMVDDEDKEPLDTSWTSPFSAPGRSASTLGYGPPIPNNVVATPSAPGSFGLAQTIPSLTSTNGPPPPDTGASSDATQTIIAPSRSEPSPQSALLSAPPSPDTVAQSNNADANPNPAATLAPSSDIGDLLPGRAHHLPAFMFDSRGNLLPEPTYPVNLQKVQQSTPQTPQPPKQFAGVMSNGGFSSFKDAMKFKPGALQPPPVVSVPASMLGKRKSFLSDGVDENALAETPGNKRVRVNGPEAARVRDINAAEQGTRPHLSAIPQYTANTTLQEAPNNTRLNNTRLTAPHLLGKFPKRGGNRKPPSRVTPNSGLAHNIMSAATSPDVPVVASEPATAPTVAPASASAPTPEAMEVPDCKGCEGCEICDGKPFKYYCTTAAKTLRLLALGPWTSGKPYISVGMMAQLPGETRSTATMKVVNAMKDLYGHDWFQHLIPHMARLDLHLLHPNKMGPETTMDQVKYLFLHGRYLLWLENHPPDLSTGGAWPTDVDADLACEMDRAATLFDGTTPWLRQHLMGYRGPLHQRWQTDQHVWQQYQIGQHVWQATLEGSELSHRTARDGLDPRTGFEKYPGRVESQRLPDGSVLQRYPLFMWQLDHEWKKVQKVW